MGKTKVTDYFECKQQMEDLRKLAEIDTAHKLAVNMQQEAAKYAKLAELAANDEIRVLRDSLRGRWVYLLYLTTGANKWLNMPKENQADTCEEKEHFDNLTDRISEALDTEIEITGISFLGFNNVAAYITFTIKNDFFDREFELTIPDTEKLHKNNLLELDYGKVKLCVRDYVNSSVWNLICSSYILSDLQAKFKDFITPKPV